MIKKLLTASFCVLFPLAVVGQKDLYSGLVACYPFSGNATDATGNGHNGIVKGATLTKDRFGNNNSAYSFANGNYIDISSPAFKNNTYSYSVWARNTADPEDGVSAIVISIGESTTGVHQTININNDYINAITGWSVGGYNSGTPRVSTVQKGVTQAKNVWYHVVSVRNNNTITMYLNGQLIGSSSTNGTLPDYGSPTAATIGIRCNQTQPFRGDIDDILIYNRAISAAEVLELYQKGTPCQLVTPTTQDMSRCGAGSVTLTASRGSNYRWYNAPTGGQLVFEGNPFITPSLKTTIAYYVSSINGNQESERTKAEVTIYPLPELMCSFPAKVLLGELNDYTAQVIQGTPPYYLTWDFGDSTFVSTPQTTLTHAYPTDGVYQISVRVTDKNGCTAQCSNIVETVFNLFIPNFFTPNTDEENPVFTIYDSTTRKRYQGNRPFNMNIYNRWGRLVAHSDNATKGWNGDQCSDGVYFYDIRFGNNTYKGWVHLLR